MDIKIPTSWKELNNYQIKKLSVLLFSEDKKNSISYFIKLIEILVCSKKSIKQYLKFRRLMLLISYKEFIPYMTFLHDEPELYEFPKIDGLKETYRGLSQLKIKQFSVIDFIFYNWMDTKKEIYLRQLVASLYTFYNFKFLNSDEWLSNLPKVADKTDLISLEDKLHIAFIYMNCRNRIIKKYPLVFPIPKEPMEDDIIRPDFGPLKKKYIPFNQVIIGMAMEETKPLGNYQQAKETNIFDFLEVFSNTIRIKKELAKNA